MQAREEGSAMTTVSVRYIVDDVDAAIAFYCGHLGFTRHASGADVRDALPRRSASRAERAGRRDPAAARRCRTGRGPSRAAGTGSRSRSPTSRRWSTSCARRASHFRNEIVTGVGGKQILLDDPSGNPVELFEPTRAEARLHDPATSDPAARPIRCDPSGGSNPRWSIPQTRRTRATRAPRCLAGDHPRGARRHP